MFNIGRSRALASALNASKVRQSGLVHDLAHFFPRHPLSIKLLTTCCSTASGRPRRQIPWRCTTTTSSEHSRVPLCRPPATGNKAPTAPDRHPLVAAKYLLLLTIWCT